MIVIKIITFSTTPRLFFAWTIGSLLTTFWLIQRSTGLILLLLFNSKPEIRFWFRLEAICKNNDVYCFFILFHQLGATFLFVLIYTHIYKSIYYNIILNKRKKIWIRGLSLYFLLIAISFVGYILPFGQIRYWGAVVILNFFTVIPTLGNYLIKLIIGSFRPGTELVSRFEVIHFLLPLASLLLIGTHILFLHKKGRYDKIALRSKAPIVPFFPYFLIKDIFVLSIFLGVFLLTLLVKVDFLFEPLNKIRSNPRSTPEHIVPEWYFLPYFAILKSLPDKLGGVLFLLRFFVVVLLKPLIVKVYSFKLRKIRQILFRISFIIIGYLGKQKTEYPLYELRQFMSVLIVRCLLLI